MNAEAFRIQVTRDINATLGRMGWRGRVWAYGLAAIAAFGLAAYIQQLVYGLEVTGLNDTVSWGLYMTNFVFFIGVSHAGTLISAILRVTNAEWRRPITRMAEAITLFALVIGAPFVFIDMGRPDRLHHILMYGRHNSPILWDVYAVATYITGSLLYLYVAMVPDLAELAKSSPLGRPAWRSKLYRVMSLGYQDTPARRKRLNIALATMAVIIIPVAISVHTVISWIFGMTLRPGWHSTIFGPYFVVGAIFSGIAAILLAMAVFRKVYKLQRYLTYCHFRKLGNLLLAVNLIYIYFTVSEYLTVWYGAQTSDMRLLDMLTGRFGTLFWSMVVFGLFLPAGMLMIPSRRKSISTIIVASVFINIGMWIKRYIIVVPTMMVPFVPLEAAGITPEYSTTWVEWAITGGAFAAFLLLFTLFSRVFPIISVWETVEGVEEHGAERIGLDLEVGHELGESKS